MHHYKSAFTSIALAVLLATDSHAFSAPDWTQPESQPSRLIQQNGVGLGNLLDIVFGNWQVNIYADRFRLLSPTTPTA